MMCGRKVLIVLNIDQLEVLAGEPNWFKSRSRIIITTRDEQVLVAHRVNIIYNINLLSHTEAICLFSKYAIRRENPIQGYKELSEEVLQYADGLPLTIKVLVLLHPDEPNRHSRLWNCKEIEDILFNEWGTQATKCTTLRTEE